MARAVLNADRNRLPGLECDIGATVSEPGECVVEIRSTACSQAAGKRSTAWPTGSAFRCFVSSGRTSWHTDHRSTDPDAYVLIRAYRSVEDRVVSQQAFYGSQAWKSGPREAIVSLIVNDIDVLVWLTSTAVEVLRSERLRGSHSKQRDRIVPR